MFRGSRLKHGIRGLGVAGVAIALHAHAAAPESAAAQSRVAQAMALGPQQAALEQLLGTWDVDIVLGGEGAAARHSKGRAEYSWVVQGRWLGCHLTGTMLGVPYEQFTLLGYDSYAQNIVEVSVESVDNTLSLSRGAPGAPGQPVTALFGELDEYTSGVLHRPYKVLLKRISPDRHVTSIFGFDETGREVKKLELVFSRSH